jgi:hypothetical protein
MDTSPANTTRRNHVAAAARGSNAFIASYSNWQSFFVDRIHIPVFHLPVIPCSRAYYYKTPPISGAALAKII